MVSPQFTQMGMQGRTFDDTFDGMLFLMDDEEHNFWMKNCITPLDIIFIKAKKISKIHHNCPPCKKEPCATFFFAPHRVQCPDVTVSTYQKKSIFLFNFFLYNSEDK